MEREKQSRIRWVVSTADLKFFSPEGKLKDYAGVKLLLIDDKPEPIVCFWMLWLSQRRSNDTTKAYAAAITSWWKMLLNAKPSSLCWWSVTATHYEDWLEHLESTGLSASSTNAMGAAVCSFYAWAHAKGWIGYVPFRMADSSYRRRKREGTKNRIPASSSVPTVKPRMTIRREPRSDSTSEFDKILAHLPNEDAGLLRRDELMAECARWIGLRRQEVVGLKVQQLRDLVEVRLSPNDPVPFFVLDLDPATTKGCKGGLVLLIPALAKKLRDYVAPGAYRDQIVQRARQRVKSLGEKYVEPKEIFLTVHGTPVPRETLSSYWRRAAKKAGIDSRFHRNRHAAATNIAKVTFQYGSAGYLIIKNQLRHADIETSQIYIDMAELKEPAYQAAMSLNDLYQKDTERGGY